MNTIFKTKSKVEIDSNYYLVTDTFNGVCLVQHYPAKKEDKEGKEVNYTAEDKSYHNTVAQALNKYVELKQIILPEISEMLEVQKQVLSILEDFKTKYKNWE